MKYFKNTELAKLYHVSEKSVRNWIEAAQAGKLELQLYQQKDKFFVANVSKNTDLIEKLVEKGKKFKNTRGAKKTTPLESFYKQYTPAQIFDIISSIDTYHEVPYEYSYFGDGAKLWDEYVKAQLAEKISNTQTNTIELLDVSEDYLEKLLGNYKHVNVVDIGPGNGIPVIHLLEWLTARDKLNRYIALDISPDMLKIAETNIQKQFSGTLPFEGYIKDIRQDRFDELLAPDSFGMEDDSTVNLALFLGGTIANMRKPERALANIHDSLGKNDLFILSRKLDTVNARRYFDFVPEIGGQNHIFRGKLLLEMLNIPDSYYTMEQTFDSQEHARKVVVHFNVALTISFEFEGKIRTISLNKDDRILLWRASHQSFEETIDQFRNNDFEPLLAARSKDKQYFEIISRITPSD